MEHFDMTYSLLDGTCVVINISNYSINKSVDVNMNINMTSRRCKETLMGYVDLLSVSVTLS